MSIPRHIAATQIARFMFLPFPPPEAGLVELITTLEQKAMSEQHAIRTVTELIHYPGLDQQGNQNRQWPTPGIIIETLWRLRPQKVSQCELCYGSTWVCVEKSGVSFAKRCECFKPEDAR